MNKIKEFAENHEENVILYILLGFFIGVLVGFVVSPIKKGITVFSNNGCDNEIKDNGRNNSADSSKRIEKK